MAATVVGGSSTSFRQLVHDVVAAHDREIGVLQVELKHCRELLVSAARERAPVDFTAECALDPKRCGAALPDLKTSEDLNKTTSCTASRLDSSKLGSAGPIDHAMELHSVQLTLHGSNSGLTRERFDSSHSLAPDLAACLSDGLQLVESAAEKVRQCMDRLYIPRCCQRPLDSVAHWWSEAEEPERTGLFATIVYSGWFNALSFLVIMCNAAFMVYLADAEMREALQHDVMDERTRNRNYMIEICFTSYFTAELLLKISVHRLWFLFNRDQRWNLFDLGIVSLALLELTYRLNDAKVLYLRLLRIFKGARVLRVMRGVKFFRELRLLFDCVAKTLVQLIWSMAMTVLVLYVFAIVFIQGLTHYVQTLSDTSDGKDLHTREQIELSFGNVWRSMVSLFQAATGGIDWKEQYDLIARAGFQLVYLLFISFFVIAAWNVVTSTFVERALHLAVPNVEDFMSDRHCRDAQCAKQLIKILRDRMDEDNDGYISVREFNEHILDKEICNFFRAHDIDLRDAQSFFNMLRACHSGDEAVDVKTLVGCALRLRGAATSVDLQTLHFDTKVMFQRTADKLEEIQNLIYSIATLSPSVCSPSATPLRAPRYHEVEL